MNDYSDQGNVQAQTGVQRFATVSGFERHVSWKRCATGFEISFSCLVGVSKISAQSAATYKPLGVKETARTMGPRTPINVT